MRLPRLSRSEDTQTDPGWQVESGRAALLLFFGLFWATVLSSVDDFRPFDTAGWFRAQECAKSFARWWVSFLIVDLLPAIGLYGLYKSHRVIPADSAGDIGILCAAIASLAVFAVPRLLHAFIATRTTRRAFYSDDEWSQFLQGPKGTDDQRFHVHFLPGLFYIVFFLGLASAIGWWFDP